MKLNYILYRYYCSPKLSPTYFSLPHYCMKYCSPIGFIGTPFRRNGCQIRNSVKTVPYIKIFAQTMPSRASFRNMHRSQHLYTPFVGENSSNTCLFFANVLFAFPPELDTVEIVPKAAAHIFQSWHTSEALLQKKYMWQCKLPAVGGLPTMYGSMG